MAPPNLRVSVGATAAEEIIRKLKEFGDKAPRALATALYEEGLALEAVSTPMVPVDTGRLRATHYVAPPVFEGGQIRVEVGYGTDYAVYVHERTELRHTNGQAKFLERALHERMRGYLERLAKRTAKNLRELRFTVPLSSDVPTRPQDPGELAFLGPSRRDMLRGKKAERRAKVRAKRKAARQAREERKATARALRRARKAFERRERRAAKREQQQIARDLRRARKAFERRERKRLAKIAKAEQRRLRRQAKTAAKRKRKELAALERLRQRMDMSYFDF